MRKDGLQESLVAQIDRFFTRTTENSIEKVAVRESLHHFKLDGSCVHPQSGNKRREKCDGLEQLFPAGES